MSPSLSTATPEKRDIDTQAGPPLGGTRHPPWKRWKSPQTSRAQSFAFEAIPTVSTALLLLHTY